MPADTIDSALVAINAAWACKRLYGDGRPAIEMHARRAAEALAAQGLPCRVVFLENKVVCDGVSLPSGKALCEGAFARLGRGLPDCLELRQGISPDSILRLIAALESGRWGDDIEGLRLCWVDRAPDALAPGEELITIGDPAFLSHELRTLWDQTAVKGEAPVKSVEALAGDVVTAVSAGSATVLPMANLKNHDEYTYVHAINVGVMSSALARAVGLSQDRVFDITCAALLHDVGKSTISLEIINKTGKLNDIERARMNDHPAEGAALLAASPGLAPVAVSVAYEHHMTLDGGGYPKAPKGWKVALASQVVHIADVFDALRTHRSYRKAMPLDKAIEILDAESGVAYDADLYRVFVDHVLNATPRAIDAESPEPRAA